MLLAADGLPHSEGPRRAGVSVPVVREWRAPYQVGGIRALEHQPRAGRPRTGDETAIVITTLEKPPDRLGVTHWSSRLLARELGVSSRKLVSIGTLDQSTILRMSAYTKCAKAAGTSRYIHVARCRQP